MTNSWKTVALGKVATLQRGYDLPYRVRKPGVFPIVTSAGVNGSHCESRVYGPGVVTGRYGTIGEVFFVREDFWPLNTTLFVKDFHGNDPLFVSYLLRTIDFKSHSGKSGVPGVNRNDLHELVVRVPTSTDEQRAIAAALSDVDALIEALDRLSAKKRDLKQATMLQLLSGQTRLPGFSGKWERARLECLSAFITKGSTPTTYGYDWENDGVLFLRSECVSEAGLDLGQSMFISEAAHAILRRSETRNGDILMTITGNVGRVVYLDGVMGSANINQHIARIRVVQSKANAKFVYHTLAQPLMRQYYGSITTGQAYPQISLRQVRETLVPLPPVEEQAAIATVLSDMDAELAALEQRLKKTRLLKQGMMQELLTGRTCLV